MRKDNGGRYIDHVQCAVCQAKLETEAENFSFEDGLNLCSPCYEDILDNYTGEEVILNSHEVLYLKSQEEIEILKAKITRQNRKIKELLIKIQEVKNGVQ